ncbi:DUF2634 domain-containing protein [Lysinibacillus sphaericus]|uniref:DUF2634 domain-containing protein n=1 Tax=Lysinibacillus sphaericus TaxID=1421 RepID=UPI003CFFEA73
MFPDDISDYIKNEDYINDNTLPAFTGKTFLYDFNKGDFIYKNGAPVEVDGIKAIQIWIEKVIRTERFKFNIYDGVDYGVTIEDLIGSNLPRGFIESEMKREFTESLLTNPYIEELINWSFKIDGSEWTISFTVITTTEEVLEMGVKI